MLAASWNVPSPLPSSIEIIGTPNPLATTRSDLPSPLKSPTATDLARYPTRLLLPLWKLPSPLPNNTQTLPGRGVGGPVVPTVVTTKSALPSSLKSPIASDPSAATPWLMGAWKVPSPFPNTTERKVARSSFPSPLKSPTATVPGFGPASNERVAAKLGVEHASANAGPG